ncbi:hypothetical protein R5R35_002764 [Gryllus longicercus]|uniref:HP domain-containing protein n=1 Tax=Gryllus longicercus TaxID=2509291 RepID=A0AAN9W6R6_9ORTH
MARGDTAHAANDDDTRPPTCNRRPPSTPPAMPARTEDGLWTQHRRFRRTMAAATDPAFKVISPTHTGFHIWRIENMQVVPVPKATWGSFYDGDSYIIYAASEYGKAAAADAKVYQVTGNSMEIHIHFWLGNDTSQDEAGVAAYKTVELDDYLGGTPTQHREAQGMESGRFKSYFKDGITILKGGVESGFNKVTDDFEPKLFHVKGRRQPTVTQLPAISWEYFNDGDVFILDTKEVVFLWIGQGANAGEKLKAAVVAGKLRDDHNASALVFVDDGDEQDMHAGEKKIFNEHLNLSERVIKSAEEAGADDEVESGLRNLLTLYQCEDEDGTYKVVELKSGPLYQSDLHSDGSFIVDNGIHGCWVWIGKRTPQKERTEAVRNAHGFVTKKGYPATTPVTRVVDGGEPTEFRVLFQSWKDKNQMLAVGRSAPGGRVAITVQTKQDAATFYDQPHLAADNQLWDDGSGSCTVWRIKDSELEEVPNKLHGLFFAGDSYVIHYSYWANGTEHHVLYYWLGDQSSDDEREVAALKVEEKDNELGGEALEIRVLQEKEPAHFLAMFHRGILIFNGGYVSADDGEDSEDTGIPQTFLLQVQGNNSYNTRATQVELQASSLNSNDVFVLKGKNNCYVWCGKGSTGDEREMAKHIAEIASKGDFAFVSEGQEKNDFWEEIGGKDEYVSDKRIADGERLPARLFQLFFKGGSIRVEEIINYQQCDLLSEDIMVLDIHDTIYLWIGKDSNEDERKKAVSSAVQYLETDPKGRDRKTPIIQVKQGFEPPTFTGFFPAWDPSLWDEATTFEKLRMQIEEQNPVIKYNGNDDVESGFTSEQSFYEHPKYSLEFLQETPADELPEDVNKLHKELHLSKDDFVTAFQMDYQTFCELPTWKQTNLKKEVRLF